MILVKFRNCYVPIFVKPAAENIVGKLFSSDEDDDILPSLPFFCDNMSLETVESISIGYYTHAYSKGDQLTKLYTFSL